MIAARRVGLLVACLSMAALAARVAAVLAGGEVPGGLATQVWPNHPAVAMSQAFAAIATSAAAGRAPSADVLQAVHEVARRDPLNPGPVLVEGTRSLAAGDVPGAERRLLAAAALHPLAPAPHFLLAQLYLRQGRGPPAFAQLRFLFARLGGNVAPLVPALAQFATQPGAAAQLQPLLADQPDLRRQVLTLLADQPSNLPVITALAPRRATSDDTEWQGQLLTTLVAAQQYAQAHALWRAFTPAASASDGGIFNPNFRTSPALPPFNWQLATSAAGTAEAQPGGGLHLLYFGRDDAVLAQQLLLLAPGRYRLQFTLRGQAPGLTWAVTCLPGAARQEATLYRQQLNFVVPATGCRAQRLELRATAGDSPQTVDAALGPLTLLAVGPS